MYTRITRSRVWWNENINNQKPNAGGEILAVVGGPGGGKDQ